MSIPYMDLGDGSRRGIPGNFQVQGILEVQNALINGFKNDDGRALRLDIDSQHASPTAQQIIQNKIYVHTSVTGAGNFTFPDVRTAGSGLADQFRFHFKCLRTGDHFEAKLVNDGTQTVTLVAGANMTLVPATRTVVTNTSVDLLFVCTDATKGSETFTVYA